MPLWRKRQVLQFYRDKAEVQKRVVRIKLHCWYCIISKESVYKIIEKLPNKQFLLTLGRKNPNPLHTVGQIVDNYCFILLFIRE